MKALIYYGPKDIKMEEIPKPVAGEKEVVVKVARAGICGSDVTAYLFDGHPVSIYYKGEHGKDGQFGHEMVGYVESIGAGVEGIEIGDRVFINPMKCKRDGMEGCDTSGAFSEYVLVEDAEYGYNMLKLDDDMSFDEAVLLEPLSVGTHGKNQINVKPEDHVVIYGAGTIGLCALSAVLNTGVKDPVIVDLDDGRLAYAKKMGALTFNPTRDGEIADFIVDHFGTVMTNFGIPAPNADCFIDCAGAQPLLTQMIDVAKPDARIAIVAVHKKPANFSVGRMSAKELTIRGSLGYSMIDIKEAFENIKNDKTGIKNIVTNVFPHEDAVHAFEIASNPKTGAIKVVLNYE